MCTEWTQLHICADCAGGSGGTDVPDAGAADVVAHSQCLCMNSRDNIIGVCVLWVLVPCRKDVQLGSNLGTIVGWLVWSLLCLSSGPYVCHTTPYNCNMC